MIGLKSCGQRNLDDDGRRDWREEIKDRLDMEYPGWQTPKKTTMVPPKFDYKSCNPDQLKGEDAEKKVFDILQEFGEMKKEGMFVVHSANYREKIYQWNNNLSDEGKEWLAGEHDFVVIHPHHGIVFFQVKAAAKTSCAFTTAKKQLEDDQKSLQAFCSAHLAGSSAKKGHKDHLYKSLGFVVMPNCPRPDWDTNYGIFKEDCETVEAFAKWWENNIILPKKEEKKRGSVDQELYKCLVMSLVGMNHCSPCLNDCIDKSLKVLIFKTEEQLKVMLSSTPEQWITGPAGSGKTWLLIEKAKILARKAIVDKTDLKILVVCFNLPLSKMLRETFKERYNSKELSSVVEVKTFFKLVCDITRTKKCGETDQEKEENVELAVKYLEQDSRHSRQYDHIFVDECQDLCGDRWPILFEKLCKNDNEDDSQHVKWFFYDTNQHLGLSEGQYRQHRKALKKSAKLSKVLRNTGNIFNQSRKYFKSTVPNDERIELGHQECGLAITWDTSLQGRQVTEGDGARVIVKYVNELHSHKVQDKDICVLVKDREIRDKLSSELKLLKVETQDAEKLYEENENKVVIESVWRFKGLEAKVVLLYNPPFFIDRDWSVNRVKEILYTAVSRCFCYLVVITTEHGYSALKSDEGVVNRKRKHSRASQVHNSKDLESENRSQMNALFNEPYGKKSIDAQYESGPSEVPPTTPHSDEDNELDETATPSEKMSQRMEENQKRREYEQLQKSLEPKRPRLLKVDGSPLLEPGDTEMLKDSVRERVFNLLELTVQQNLPEHSKSDSKEIVARIEHEVYCRHQNDPRTNGYTQELRNLKKQIEECNKKGEYHESVDRNLKKKIEECDKKEERQ